MALMNTMCDMPQFVVVVLVPDEASATLADYFFPHVLMKFGLCHIIVLDDINPFKGAFVAMCRALKLNYAIFSKHNYKRLLVEHFHFFLNKAITITIEDRQSNIIFIPTGIVTGYTWNSAPIDITDSLRCTVAIG